MPPKTSKPTMASVFRRVDKDKDKTLSKDEVKEFVKDAGVGKGWLGGTKVNMATNEMMDKFDSDKNERVTWDEFKRSAKHALPVKSGRGTNLPAEAASWHGKADRNADSGVDSKELSSTIERELKQNETPMAGTVAEVASKIGMHVIDENKDGKVDADELGSLAEDIQSGGAASPADD